MMQPLQFHRNERAPYACHGAPVVAYAREGTSGAFQGIRLLGPVGCREAGVIQEALITAVAGMGQQSDVFV